jgi:hypothetical protein
MLARMVREADARRPSFDPDAPTKLMFAYDVSLGMQLRP